MRWKIFAVLVGLSYVWSVCADLSGVPRSQMMMIGSICLGLFSTIGVLLYAFERELFSGWFWTWFSRVYLAWTCTFGAVVVLRTAILAYSVGPMAGIALLCIVAFIGVVYFFQWLALSRHARGELLR